MVHHGEGNRSEHSYFRTSAESVSAAAMPEKEPSREELFAMVWERPSTEVARDLGISDVALTKLCRRLQVPKPSPGYWAKVRAGKEVRRPPLEAFQAERSWHIRKRLKRDRVVGSIHLPPRQREYFLRALEELDRVHVDTSDCEVGPDSVRKLDGNLAAQILILSQNRYPRWVAERTESYQHQAAARRTLAGLVKKLLPLARGQILIFQREALHARRADSGLAVAVRLSPELQLRIAHLCVIARENRLSYVAAKLGKGVHAWDVRHAYDPRSFQSVETEMCVSAHDVWLRCSIRIRWTEEYEHYEMQRFPLSDVVPVDLLPTEEIRLPPLASRTSLRPYADRLKAIRDSQNALDILEVAAAQTEMAVPDENLALADRLFMSQGGEGPFVKARQAWRHLDEHLERWAETLRAEESELCRDVLGVEAGDIVVAESAGKMERIRVDDTDVIVREDEVTFYLHGRRFRKDGTIGKRTESLFVSCPVDE